MAHSVCISLGTGSWIFNFKCFLVS